MGDRLANSPQQSSLLSLSHEPVKLHILINVTRLKQPVPVLVVKQSHTLADSLELKKCHLHKVFLLNDPYPPQQRNMEMQDQIKPQLCAF